MLLIRGIYGKEHALKINQGHVGCRDVQSALMDISRTGYAPSDYHETLFMNTRFNRLRFDETIASLPRKWAKLALIMHDHFLAESYLCYFHILNPEGSINWLEDNWRDDAHFIYYEPRCEFSTSVIGNRYCGQKMRYVNSAAEINVRETIADNPGTVVVMLDQESYPNMPIDIRNQYLIEAQEAIAPLFNRIVDPFHDASENEFRILVRSSRSYQNGTIRIEGYNPMRVQVGEAIYDVETRVAEECDTSGRRLIELVFRDRDSGILHEMWELVEIGLPPQIEAHFYDLDIRDTAKRYGYIGTKSDCRRFMEEELSGTSNRNFEDDNHHIHHGQWQDYMTSKPLNVRKHISDTILIPPQNGYYE